MELQEIVHKLTYEIRDSLEHDKKKHDELCAKYKTYEDNAKQHHTEITKNKAIEEKLKKDIADTKNEIEKVQHRLEEIDRQRSELNNRLKETLAREEKLKNKLEDSQKATEKLQAQTKAEAQLHENTKNELEKFEKEKEQIEKLLKKKMGEALDNYLNDLDKKIEQTFLAQEEQLRRESTLNAFKKARKEDPEIGDLCDQHDQFIDFFKKATVPGVKKSMELALKKIEEKLEKRFPGILAVEDSITPKPNLVEELFYYDDHNGKTFIILPISESIWNGIKNGDNSHNSTRAMFFVWNMAKNTNLGPENGRFLFNGRYCVFETDLNISKNLVSKGFNILIPKSSNSIKFKFSPLPIEIQEALAYEISDT